MYVIDGRRQLREVIVECAGVHTKPQRGEISKCSDNDEGQPYERAERGMSRGALELYTHIFSVARESRALVNLSTIQAVYNNQDAPPVEDENTACM